MKDLAGKIAMHMLVIFAMQIPALAKFTIKTTWKIDITKQRRVKTRVVMIDSFQ